MKKISYLVLMAAMLLISTNVGATTHEVATDAQFETAWKNASSGDVIKLTDAITLTKTMWLGTTNMNDASRKIEIDLNGYNLLSSAQYSFLLTHGTLKISNSRPASGQVQGTYTKYDGKGAFSGSANLFYVTGSTNKDVDPSEDGVNYYTHLEIGEGVIVTQAHYDALVTIAEENKGGVAQVERSSAIPAKPALTYITNVYGTNETNGKAVAHGVRLDLKGTINGTKYGIKTNGNLGSPFERVKAGTTSVTYAATSTFENVKTYTIENADADRCPYVYIHPTGRITVWNAAPAGTDRNPIGVYASGYARWKVEGYAEGCNGAVIKSGQVDFTDATVIGTGPVYEEATASSSGTSSSGSGIVIASTDAYAGNIEVSIGGDSEISSQNGYAVEEVITSSDNKTDVETVVITGGSFEGSADQGTIKITEETTTNESTVVEVTGGQVVGADPEDPDVVNIGGLSLTEFLETAADEGTQEKTHITVTTNEEGEKVMVIVTGETPTGSEDISSHDKDDAVNWKHASSLDKTAMAEDITADLVLDQLQINQDYAQVVTVKEGKTLEVGSVVLGENAQIIVEPGATFKVTKKDGIYARQTSNLILQTEAGNPSIFLFNPAVSTNAHPHATVQFKSVKSFFESMSNYQWERFGLPTWKTVLGISCNKPALETDIQVYTEDGTWEDLGILKGSSFTNIAKLNKPFISFNLLPNTGSATPAEATYSFEGELTGNMDASLNVHSKWTAFANSYSAYVDGAQMVAGLDVTNVDKAIYLGEHTGNGHYTWTPYDAEWIGSKKLAPMEAFMLYNGGNVAEALSINYKNSVYDPAVPASPTPRRAASNKTAKMRIVVMNAQGEWDDVKITEKSENLNNATKYMNEGMNMYAHLGEEKLGIIAREDLDGTYFGFSTEFGGEFTISFTNVEGREFELVDLEKNASIIVAEGNTYTFKAARNSTSDYRFKLVSSRKVPTAIDNVNTEKNVSGIYTMMGQYVGDLNLWNTLPAGVYVVNGEKRVK